MNRTEKQISFYSALAVALMLNSAKLLALREGRPFAQFWRFDAGEFCFQLTMTFLFCYLFFLVNLGANPVSALREKNRTAMYVAANALIFFILTTLSAISFRLLFFQDHVPVFFRAIHFSRMSLALILTGVMIKIMLLMRETARHAHEKQQLKTSYMKAELELLKGQMNPHFLFNSLSSLSAIVRENPALAQQYIVHLSRVFRYALERPENNVVQLRDELRVVESFARLLKMRFEDSFCLVTDIGDRYLGCMLPHLSLQPLLENAAKHNAATKEHPLQVRIFIEDGWLVISNNLNPVEAESSGLGLVNLNERFRILMQREIVIEKKADSFIVKLPLQNE